VALAQGKSATMYDLAWVKSLTREQLPAASLELAALQCAIAARLAEASDKPATAAASELLTASQMASILGVKESWLRSRARAGKLPVIVLGRYRRYDARAVRAAALALEAKP
jgi:hypothetical protein